MAGETNPLKGRSFRERKRSYKDFLTEDDELEDELAVAEQHIAPKSHKDSNAYFKKRKHSVNHTYCWANGCLDYETAFPNFLTTYQTCDSSNGWREGEGSSETREESFPMYWVYVDDKLAHSEACAVGYMADEVSPSLKDPDLRPIEAAAHLQLLGESLSLIGHRLQGTKEMVTLSGSLSLLLDSLLCALAPLACLTSQVPELNSCPSHTLADTLDNIAYVIPGL